MNVKTIVREAFSKRINDRIVRHTNSMILAASVGSKEVELHYAVRINRLRSFLFGLQQDS